MSKKNRNETPETNNDANVETPEGEATDARKPSGTSLASQCRQIVLAAARENKEHGGILGDTMEWIERVAAEIGSTVKRGLPAADQLAALVAKRKAVYAGATITDGVPEFTPEQETEIGELSAKIKRVETRIKKEAETAEAATA